MTSSRLAVAIGVEIAIKKGAQPRVSGHVSRVVLVLVLDARNRIEDEVAIGSKFDEEYEYRALP